jgi:hypothetical protein
MTSYYRILRLNHGRAPTVQHATLKEAETEALRLAGQHPGVTFEILKVIGTARTTTPSIFWNDEVEPPARYPAAPLPEGFDRWECRGFGWDPGVPVTYTTGWGFTKDRWIWQTSADIDRVPNGTDTSEYWEAVKDESRYPTTPLPAGFDRWECRGYGWNAKDAVFTTGYAGEDPNWDTYHSTRDTGTYPSLEYWEAVEDEPTYRMLKAGERMEEGDEFLVAGSNNQWLKRQLDLGVPWHPQDYTATRRPIANTSKP